MCVTGGEGFGVHQAERRSSVSSTDPHPSMVEWVLGCGGVTVTTLRGESLCELVPVVDDPRMFAKIANSIKRLLDDEQKCLETKVLPHRDQTDRERAAS
jgi:hypothetical protein